MNCAEYKRWFSPHVDKLLKPEEHAQLADHLKSCARCQADSASLQQMLQALRTMERPAAPELLPGIHAKLTREPWWQRLLQGFAAPWPISLPLHGLALATAGVLMVVLVSLPGYFRMRPEPELGIVDRMVSGRSRPSPISSFAKPSRLKEQQIGMEERPRSRKMVHEGKPIRPPAESIFDKKETQRGAYRRDEAFDGGETREKAPPQRALAAASATPMNATALVNLPNTPAADHRTVERNGSVSAERDAVVASSHNNLSQMEEGTLATRTSGDTVAQATSGPVMPLGGSGGTKSMAKALVEPVVYLRILDAAAARTAVTDWVEARHGSIRAISEHQLVITLPPDHIAPFLRQFSSDSSMASEDFNRAQSAPWVTIQLELVSPQ